MKSRYLISLFDDGISSDDMTPEKKLSDPQALILSCDLLLEGNYTRAEVYRKTKGHFRLFANLINTPDCIRLELFERC